MTRQLLLQNGCVYDPLNGIDGEIKDICIADGGFGNKIKAMLDRRTVSDYPLPIQKNRRDILLFLFHSVLQGSHQRQYHGLD